MSNFRRCVNDKHDEFHCSLCRVQTLLATCMYSLLWCFAQIHINVIVTSKFVAEETIQVADLTLASQVLNVTLTMDYTSGIMGLCLSSISASVPNSF